jgi:hypothetical protein
MRRRWILVVGLGALGLLDLSLLACGASEDFGDGGTDATVFDATRGDAGPGSDEPYPTVDSGPPQDAGSRDSMASDVQPFDAGPPGDVVGNFDAPRDSGVSDVLEIDVVDSGPICGDCDAGTVVTCMCGVHWSCTSGGCWNPDFTCSGPCMAPAVCLPPGAPVDLGVVECASGFSDGSFLPCCSGSSSALLCNGTCS